MSTLLIPKKKIPSKLKWAVYGTLFGFAFPLIATLIRINQFGVNESYSLFINDPLLWIIMTAPLFLGVFAFIGGLENDRVRLIRENLELSNIQASKMASLGEMAGGIAHEINNPLAIISGKASTARSRLEICTVTPEEAKIKVFEDLQKIDSTVDRIAKIIKGLKTFSRNAENDKMEKFSLNTMIEDSFELCREKFNYRKVELKIDLSETKYIVEGRSAQLSQVLLNLLNNSLDAIEHLPEKWVDFRVKALPNGILISITDSGNGIPNKIKEKIMQPFFTTKEVGKGTGLGLSISKGIIEDHHGKFYYDESSKNTCFKIELPYSQPA